MLTLIRKLCRIRLLSLPGFWYLLQALWETGTNLMSLVRIAAKLHPRRTAVVDERERLSYRELWEQAECLAKGLSCEHGIQRGQKVALICRNHISAVKSIFAVSRLGAHLYLLNPDMSRQQILQLDERWKFDFYIYDSHLGEMFSQSALNQKSLPAYHPTNKSIDRLSAIAVSKDVRLRKVKPGNMLS